MALEVLVVERFEIRQPPIAEEMRISLVIRDTDPPYSPDRPWFSEPFDLHIPLAEYSPAREREEIRKVLDQYRKMRKPEVLEAVGWPPE